MDTNKRSRKFWPADSDSKQKKPTVPEREKPPVVYSRKGKETK